MRYLPIRFTYIVQKKKKKTIYKMHKKNKTFSAREHRTQNTRGGVVVTPPVRTNQLPQSRKKSPPWSTRGRTLKENRTVYYSNAAPTVSAVQPVYQAARALSREVTEEQKYQTLDAFLQDCTSSGCSIVHFKDLR